MKLRALLRKLDYAAVTDIPDIDVRGITCDSEEVRAGDIFVAIKGASSDGHNFIGRAIAKGAVAIVTQRESRTANHESRTADHESPVYIPVSRPRQALGLLSAAFYGHPSRGIKVVGITGTNGKTTISYLLEQILKQAGYEAGVVGTIGYRIGARRVAGGLTTPGPHKLQPLLQKMALAGLKYAILEVSSHSLEQDRVAGIDFDTAIFTNLSEEHLDYHRDMESYFNAKAKLFLELTRRAVINIDDPYGRRLKKIGTATLFLTYGIEREADIRAHNIELTLEGSRFRVATPAGAIFLRSPLLGRHNVYNILAAVGAGILQGIDLGRIRQGVERLVSVPGRLEQIDCGQGFRVFVDYAHTEDALRNILTALIEVSSLPRPSGEGRASTPSFSLPDSGGGRERGVILVFGCGGDRDKGKRAKMGKAAAELAQFVILTTDNPRREEPAAIISDIEQGMGKKNYSVILDRFQAIQKALSMAGRGDIVVIAGKGHEDYQVFKDVTLKFDDREAVRRILGGLCSPSRKS